MKRQVLIVAIAFIGLTLNSCISLDGDIKEGNGNIVTRNYDVTAFDNIFIPLPATVNFSVSDSYSCTVRMDENLFDYLEVKVRGGKLRLGPPKLKDHKQIIFSPTEFIIDITAPSLKEIYCADTDDLNFISPLNEKELNVKMAGSGNVIFKEEANVDHLKLNVAGSSDIYLEKGSIRELEALIAGSGKIMSHAEVQDMDANVAGSGDITAKVNGTLDYFIAGSGDIKYYGDAKVNGKIAGSGNVKQIDAPAR